MEKKHISDLLPDYLDGTLSSQDKERVERHIKENPGFKLELDELRMLFKAMEKEPFLEPSDMLRSNFEAALEAEKIEAAKVVNLSAGVSKNKLPSNIFKVAASLALVVASFLAGKMLEQQESNRDIALLKDETLQFKQTAMLSLMENQSASKRIQGVRFIEEFTNPDDAIVKALGSRLLHDENDNVRLNAFEALSRFIVSENVKQIFIEALEAEKNPSIQIGIIQVLVKIQERKAAAPMQKLLEQEDTQPFVKNEINLGLPKII